MTASALLSFAARKERPAPPGPLHGMRVMTALAVRELVISKKSLLVVLLGAALVAAAVLQNVLVLTGFVRRANVPMFYGFMVTEAFLRFFLPVVSLFYGAALVTDEVDGRTLTYLTTRPVDKRILLYGKFAGFLLVATAILEVTLCLCWLAFATAVGAGGLGAHALTLAKDGAATVMGLLAYGAFFTFLGAFMRKPVMPGLIFAFVWEQIASFLPGGAQRLTILHYLQAITPHTLEPLEDLPFLSSLYHDEHPVVAVAALLFISGMFLWLAGVVFRNKEYRLEK